MRFIGSYAWNTATDEIERAEGIKAIGGMPPRLDGALDILSKAFPGYGLLTPRERTDHRYLVSFNHALQILPSLRLVAHEVEDVTDHSVTDEHCEKGEVLYLALDDNDGRLQKRIKKLLPNVDKWPAEFRYATEWPRADEGGLDWISNWCGLAHNPRLIVVDALAAFRSQRNSQQSPY
jgi:hypothetical protein